MTPTRVAYAALVGWWAALLLTVVAALLAGTIVGMNRALRLLELLPRVAWLARSDPETPSHDLRWDSRC